MTVERPRPAGQRFRLPTWIPGSYLIREFARHFVHVRAEAERGRDRDREGRQGLWRAAPCFGPLTVVAQVYAYDLSVRTAYLDATRGYFNGPRCSCVPEGREDAPCTVEIAPPDAAHSATGASRRRCRAAGAAPYGFGRYRAANYDELIDHPVEIGDVRDGDVRGRRRAARHRGHRPRSAPTCRASRATSRASASGTSTSSAARRAARRRSIATCSRSLAVGDGYGGLEHRASTSLALPARRTAAARRGRTSATTISTSWGSPATSISTRWNVKRIKPAAFAPYDLARENYTRQLWAFEGITSYYDDLALVRCGLIPRRALSRAPRAHDHDGAAHARAACAERGRVELRCVDQVLPAGREHAQRGRQLLRQGRARRAGAGPDAALARPRVARRPDARAVDAPRPARHRRAGGRRSSSSRASSAGRDLARFLRALRDGTEDPPLARLLAEFGVTLHLRAATDPRTAAASRREARRREARSARASAPDLKLDPRLARRTREPRRAFGRRHAGRHRRPQGVARAARGARCKRPRRRRAARRPRVPARRAAVVSNWSCDAAPLDTAWLALDADAGAAATSRRDAWLGTSRMTGRRTTVRALAFAVAFLLALGAGLRCASALDLAPPETLVDFTVESLFGRTHPRSVSLAGGDGIARRHRVVPCAERLHATHS